MLKTQNYSLAKTYFDIRNPQTHGKYKLLMTYYPCGPQTYLGYSMKDFNPNLFICGLTCDPTGRAPSSNQSIQVVRFSRKPFLFYTPPPFCCSSPSLFSHTPFPLVCITFFPCVYPYFPCFPCIPPSIFPSVSQCFSLSPSLFSFLSIYSLSLVGYSSLSFHQFTRISTFARIPRNHHAF